jgi:hypothetical protein
MLQSHSQIKYCLYRTFFICLHTPFSLPRLYHLARQHRLLWSSSTRTPIRPCRLSEVEKITARFRVCLDRHTCFSCGSATVLRADSGRHISQPVDTGQHLYKKRLGYGHLGQLEDGAAGMISALLSSCLKPPRLQHTRTASQLANLLVSGHLHAPAGIGFQT